MEEMTEGAKQKYTEEDIITSGCRYKNKRDFMKNEPNVYRAAYNRHLLFKITQDCKYKPLGNLYNRMLYMYVWNSGDVKAVYFGLTCDEDRRFREHTMEYDEMEEIETSPGCKVGSSSVNKFIQQHGKYDNYYQLTEGYIKAEIAAVLEMCAIAHFREDPEWKGNVIVVNRTKGGELGSRCNRNARPIIKDANNILKKEIASPEVFAKEFPTASKYWSERPERKKTMNRQLNFRFFDDAPYRKEEILKIVTGYTSFDSFMSDHRKAAISLRRKKMKDILFPTENIFYNQKNEKTYNTFKEVVDDLKLDFIEDYFVFERNQNEEKFGILLIPKDSVKDIDKIPDDLVESFFRTINESKTPKDRTLKYLSQLNLEPWEDRKYGMQYLVIPDSGQIIFLLISDSFECSILEHFYDMLKMFFKDDEQEMTDFVYDYLKENGLNLPFNKNDFWLSSSEDTGVASKEDGDRPIKKKNLNEGRPPSKENRFVKTWLKKYENLKKYKSEDNRFIYLADDTGQILVSLDTQINQTAVSYELILNPLGNVIGGKQARRKVIGWLLDNYHLANMGYVYDETNDMLGMVNSTDTPMETKQINESTEMETLKRYFYKKWDREKKEGKRPTIFDLDKLGLSKFRNEIVMLFVEYMGYNDVNSRSEAVKNYLMNGTFSEDDIKEMDNFDQGKIQVRFDKVQFLESENNYGKNFLDLDIEFVVLSGSFYNSEEGETYNFSSGDDPFDDFVTYFEFKEEVEQVVESFIFEVIESFGFNTKNDFDYISVKW